MQNLLVHKSVRSVSAILVIALSGLVDRTCRETPCGDTGCGPRYRGAVHEEANCPDPCDACNRWRGLSGVREMLDMLAPWQLPPGRGFRSPAEMGYDTRFKR